MKRHLLSFMLPLLALAACEKPFEEQNLPEDNLIDKLEFTAEMEQIGAGTKTTIDAQNNVLWQAGDEIAIFNKNLKADKYILKSGENTTKAIFTLLSEAEGKDPADIFANYLAVYPSTNVILKKVVDSDVFTVTIPTEQQYVKNGIDRNALIMAALSENNNLKFINLGSVLRFQLTGTQKVKSIKVMAKKSSHITGNFFSFCGDQSTLGLRPDGAEALGLVVLNCPEEGVQLSSEPTTFNAVIAPTSELTNGFSLVVEFTDGTLKEVKASPSEKNVVERNTILKMPVINVSGVKPEKPISNQLWLKTINYERPELTEILSKAGCTSISETVNPQGYWVLSFSSSNMTPNSGFENNTILEEVHFPEGYSGAISFRTFCGCTNLKKINLEDTQIKKIGDSAFEGCTSLTDITLPSTPGLYLGPCAFMGCRFITLTIPANATDTKYANSLVRDCKELHSIIIESPVFAGYDAFQGCTSLTDISFLAKEVCLKKDPSSSIELFLNFDTSTRNLTLNEHNKELPKAIQGSDKLSWKGFVWNSVHYVDDNGQPVKGPDPLPTPELDDIQQTSEVWVKTVDGQSPGQDSGDFTVSKTTNQKGYWVYTKNDKYNPELNYLYWEFENNSKITEVVLPSKVEQVYYNAFKNCVNLEKIVFPSSSLVFEYKVFYGCAKLKTLQILAETLKVDKDTFYGITTTGIDLVINEKCSVPAEGLTWAGKTWKSITKVKVDAEGNIIP